MARVEHDYLEELTMHLRLAGLDGRAVGAILEETRDHLEASGRAPEDEFGPAEDYALSLARSHAADASSPRTGLTLGDLVAGAAQFAGWLLFLPGLVGLVTASDVPIAPGHVAGVAGLTVAMVWPVWPAARAYFTGRTSIATPVAAMTTVIIGWVALTLLWDSPVLVTLPPWVAIAVGFVVIVLCWLRVWRLRDPIRR